MATGMNSRPSASLRRPSNASAKARSAGAYAYILESLKHYPAQHAVAAKMRELGLANVSVVSLLGGAMSINYGEKPPPGRVD